MAVFFNHHLTERKTIRQSSTILAEELILFWERARILWWKEKYFKFGLDDFFGIAHQDALILIKYAQDKEFLLAERKRAPWMYGPSRYVSDKDGREISREKSKTCKSERKEIKRRLEDHFSIL